MLPLRQDRCPQPKIYLIFVGTFCRRNVLCSLSSEISFKLYNSLCCRTGPKIFRRTGSLYQLWRRSTRQHDSSLLLNRLLRCERTIQKRFQVILLDGLLALLDRERVLHLEIHIEKNFCEFAADFSAEHARNAEMRIPAPPHRHIEQLGSIFRRSANAVYAICCCFLVATG